MAYALQVKHTKHRYSDLADAGLGHAEDVTIGILFEARSLTLSCFMRGLGQGCSQDKG